MASAATTSATTDGALATDAALFFKFPHTYGLSTAALRWRKEHAHIVNLAAEKSAAASGAGGAAGATATATATTAATAATSTTTTTAAHIPLPKVTFTGTVKLHGTNAGIGLKPDGTLWAQSRRRVVYPGSDNAGFASFVVAHEGELRAAAEELLRPQDEAVIVFGEWCGRGIQKGVALSQLERCFVVFGVAHVVKLAADAGDEADTDEEEAAEEGLKAEWDQEAAAKLRLPAASVFNVHDTPTYKCTVDLADVGATEAEIKAVTEAVGSECPFGKLFGVSGVGEGIVWRGSYLHPATGKRVALTFKSKCEQYAVLTSAPKVSKSEAKAKKKVKEHEFAVRATPEARLVQGWEVLAEKLGGVVMITPKHTRDFLTWVVEDVVREEEGTIVAEGLDAKAVRKAVGSLSATWFKTQLAAKR